MNDIPQSDWEWFGSPGHFICARWCRFHLCTKIGKYLVSTVGEYIPPHCTQGSKATENEWLKDNWPGEDIGCGRKYETMVFLCGERCHAEGCNCNQPKIASMELASGCYNERGEANRGHMALCAEWATHEKQTMELDKDYTW